MSRLARIGATLLVLASLEPVLAEDKSIQEAAETLRGEEACSNVYIEAATPSTFWTKEQVISFVVFCNNARHQDSCKDIHDVIPQKFSVSPLQCGVNTSKEQATLALERFYQARKPTH
jgi:hypothetical protein